MAAFAHRWIGKLAVLVLLASACHLSAQSWATGSIHGQLTDSQSRPLKQATVILRNESSGAEHRVVTARNGEYHFEDLLPGQYTLEATSATLGRGAIDGLLVTGGRVRMQIALDFDGGSDATNGEVGAVRTPTQRAERDDAAERVALARTQGPMKAQPPRSPASKVVAATRRDRPDDDEVVSELETLTAASPPGAGEIEATIGALGLGTNLAGFARQSALRALTATAIAQAAFQVALSRAQTIQNSVISTESAASGDATVLTGEQIQSLPLAGRHWENFADDQPPARAPGKEQTEGSGYSPISISDNVAVVDGMSTRLAFGGADRASTDLALLGLSGNEIAIAEVKIASPELSMDGGGTANARTSIETRQGSRELHGQLAVLNRQNLWGAQNPFSEWVKLSSVATAATIPTFTAIPYTPPDRNLTLEVGMGGSIRRDCLFWFAAIDKAGRSFPGVSTVKHPDNFFAQPTNDQMQVLSARLGMNGTNPVNEGIAAYSTMLGTLSGLLGPAPRASNEWLGFSRLDGRAGERHHFTVEGTVGRWDSPGGGLTRTNENYGSHSYGSSHAREFEILARWEAYLTPNLLTVTQGSGARKVLTEPGDSPSDFEQTLDVGISAQLPQIVVDSRNGFTIGNPSRFGTGNYPDEQQYQVQEQIDWVKGTMLMRAGVSLRHDRDATSMLRNHNGMYSYASVENFASDALVFEKYGMAGSLDPMHQRNCDQTGKVWRDTNGQLHGLGYLPCYAYYSQTMGPADWYLATNDIAGFATGQWQPGKQFVASASLRWQRELLPPPIYALKNPLLPLTAKLPALGNEWAPRVSLAWGKSESRWPVLRAGYGIYVGRIANSVLETALTQTGSLNGDLRLFLRPTDNLVSAGAPPFPYVLEGEPGSAVRPGAVELDPALVNAEVQQGIASMEKTLPGRVVVNASAVMSLARHLPITVDTNFDPAVNPGTIKYAVVDDTGKGPVKAPQITIPFFASWPSNGSNGGRLNPNYQQISEISSRANSTYEAMMLRVSRNARRGLSLHAHYTYAHAMDWNPNEGSQVAGSSVLDPTDFAQEYGTSDLDIRHRVSGTLIWETPARMHGFAGEFGEGWALSASGQFSSGLPYTMRTAGSIPKEFESTGAVIVGLGPSMNGYGGDNRVYGVGRNTYRYPATWKADLRLARRFKLSHDRVLELLGESFNLFNHQNVTELETIGYTIESGTPSGSGPTLHYLTSVKTKQTEFGMPLNINATDFYRARQIDFGMRLRF